MSNILPSYHLVEVRGVEPRSEREPTAVSPSAAYDLDFAGAAAINNLRLRYSLDFPVRAGKLSVRYPVLMAPCFLTQAKERGG